MPWLLYIWLLSSPDHQQPSFWPCRITVSLSSPRKGFNLVMKYHRNAKGVSLSNMNWARQWLNHMLVPSSRSLEYQKSMHSRWNVGFGKDMWITSSGLRCMPIEVKSNKFVMADDIRYSYTLQSYLGNLTLKQFINLGASNSYLFCERMGVHKAVEAAIIHYISRIDTENSLPNGKSRFLW